MFTIEQIQEIHGLVKSGADFPHYVQNLKSIGIIAYDIYVVDGHAMYYGADHFQVMSDPKYPILKVADDGSSTNLRYFLTIHQQGQTDYLTFCRQAAQAGVEKWTVHMLDMTCIYYDQAGSTLVIEEIPKP